MDRLRAALFGRRDDAINAQITLGRRCRPQQISLISQTHVQPVSVRVRIDRDRRDVQLATRADDPHRDLAAVGDQDFAKHKSRGQRLEVRG